MSKRKIDDVCEQMYKVLFSGEDMSKHDFAAWNKRIAECLSLWQSEDPRGMGRFIQAAQAAKCLDDGKPFKFIINAADNVQSLRLRAAGVRTQEHMIRRCGVHLLFISWEKAVEVLNIISDLVFVISTEIPLTDNHSWVLARAISLRKFSFNEGEFTSEDLPEPTLTSYEFLRPLENLRVLDIKNISLAFDFDVLSNMRHLEQLTLNGRDFPQESRFVLDVAQSKAFSKLVSLKTLSLNFRNVESYEFLVALYNLEELSIYGVNSSFDTKFLRNMKNLQTLIMSGSGYVMDSIQTKQLAELLSLETLSLGKVQMQDESLESIGKLTNLTSLAMMFEENIMDNGVAHLAGLKKLRYLGLMNASVTDQSLRVFLCFPELEEISLDFTKITNVTTEALFNAGIKVSAYHVPEAIYT